MLFRRQGRRHRGAFAAPLFLDIGHSLVLQFAELVAYFFYTGFPFGVGYHAFRFLEEGQDGGRAGDGVKDNPFQGETHEQGEHEKRELGKSPTFRHGQGDTAQGDKKDKGADDNEPIGKQGQRHGVFQ